MPVSYATKRLAQDPDHTDQKERHGEWWGGTVAASPNPRLWEDSKRGFPKRTKVLWQDHVLE